MVSPVCLHFSQAGKSCAAEGERNAEATDRCLSRSGAGRLQRPDLHRLGLRRRLVHCYSGHCYSGHCYSGRVWSTAAHQLLILTSLLVVDIAKDSCELPQLTEEEEASESKFWLLWAFLTLFLVKSAIQRGSQELSSLHRELKSWHCHAIAVLCVSIWYQIFSH